MAARRPGTAGAAKLLKSSDVNQWKSVLVNYDEAVARVAQAKKSPELIALDQWLWHEFPLAVKERSPPCCSKEDLTKIMQWKLLRGKNRPALLNLIKQNANSSVEEISTEAFRLLISSAGSSWKLAISKLAELRGVGPATASAILAPLAASVPFMADEPLEAVTHSKRDYTLNVYSKMHDAMHTLSEDVLGRILSPEEAGKALWVAAMFSVYSNASTMSSTKPAKKNTMLNSASKVKPESEQECMNTAIVIEKSQDELPTIANDQKSCSTTPREERRSKRAKLS